MTRRVWSDALVRSLAELIAREGMDRPIIVAQHLMADYYALRIALEYPDRVAGVVIVSGEPTRGPSWPSGASSVSAEQKARLVQERWVPFLRTVDPDTWRKGTYKPASLSRDPDTGQRLFAEQLSVPLPIQIRYFLEFLTSQLSDDLGSLDVPLLVIQPRLYESLDAFLDSRRSELETGGRTLDDVKRTILAQSGSEEIALDGANGRLAWERLNPPPPKMQFAYVDGSGIFVTEDQPEVLDAILERWVRSVREASLPNGGAR